jgi:hypothetical protein
VAIPRRDDFPNHFVGDLVPTERGWVVVPPTCCPDGHEYSDGGWSVSSVWCTCNGRHMAWRCHCGASLYAPQPGPHCRIRDRGPVSMWEDEQERTPGT